MKLNPIDIAINKMVHDARENNKKKEEGKRKNTFNVILFKLNDLFFNIFLITINFFYKKILLNIKKLLKKNDVMSMLIYFFKLYCG